MKKTLVVLVFNLLSFSLLAQVMEVGVFGGGDFYMGDMNQYSLFKEVKPSFGLTARYNFNPRVSARLDAKYNSLSATELNPGVFPDRPTTLSSNTLSVNAMGEFNFFDYFIGSKKFVISPYIFAGIGYGYNFLTVDATQIAEMKKSMFAIPFGFGVKYSITSKLGLTLDWTMTKLYNDHIDGLDAFYTKPNEIYQMSDSSTKDWISQFGLTILYKIDLRDKNRCYGVPESN